MTTLHIFRDVDSFIYSLPGDDSLKILMDLDLLEADRTEFLDIKQLSGKIRELIVRQYRLVFFRKEEIIYVIDIFKKQSRKTPWRIIKRAEKIYQSL